MDWLQLYTYLLILLFAIWFVLLMTATIIPEHKDNTGNDIQNSDYHRRTKYETWSNYFAWLWVIGLILLLSYIFIQIPVRKDLKRDINATPYPYNPLEEK